MQVFKQFKLSKALKLIVRRISNQTLYKTEAEIALLTPKCYSSKTTYKTFSCSLVNEMESIIALIKDKFY